MINTIPCDARTVVLLILGGGKWTGTLRCAFIYIMFHNQNQNRVSEEINTPRTVKYPMS